MNAVEIQKIADDGAKKSLINEADTNLFKARKLTEKCFSGDGEIDDAVFLIEQAIELLKAAKDI